MDGQNFNNDFDNNQNTDNTTPVEPTPGYTTAGSSESTVETVNVNSNYQDNTSVYGSYSYQDNNSNSGSYNYQGDISNNSNYNYQGNTSNSGNFNYQDNTAQYYTTPVYTDNYNQQGESTPGFAIASLILGIISILFCCCWGGGIVFAVPGIIMGLSANKKTKTGVGTAGIICSIVGAVFNGLMLLWFAFMVVVEIAASM